VRKKDLQLQVLESLLIGKMEEGRSRIRRLRKAGYVSDALTTDMKRLLPYS
jgi:ribosomal protein L35